MYNVQCSLFNDVSHEHKEAHAKMFSALQTVYGSGNDVSNERWARAKIIWAFSNYELESVLKLHWRWNWLFILQFGRTSLRVKNQITISSFFRPHAITIFKVIPLLHIQFLTRLWQGVQLDQVAIHSTGATSFSTPSAIYILLSICIYLPSPAPLCAQQFRPWWDRLTFGLTPSLSDSLILPSLRPIPKTFQPTQPQHQNHT